ncbi:ribonuclease P protein component [Dethiobacter alkaliphilus AHT 1]|uniref:Ribonuclease P protein component n=2 Tax=Dethiobacter TaxID=427925 RepID=C0GI74_DETAL|nr:ribonuclease P protein component [Dethiobacter alkaliphilus AHT 1]
MEKKGRITKNSEYQQVFQHGKSVASRGLVLIMLKNNANGNRTGFITSKKIGNAVIRNRVKRLLRETYKMYAADLATGYDLVFVARRPAAGFDFKQAAAEMRRVLQRGGLFTV